MEKSLEGCKMLGFTTQTPMFLNFLKKLGNNRRKSKKLGFLRKIEEPVSQSTPPRAIDCWLHKKEIREYWFRSRVFLRTY